MNTQKLWRRRIAAVIAAGLGLISLVGGAARASSIAPASSIATTSLTESVTPVGPTISVDSAHLRAELPTTTALALCPAGQIPLLKIAALPASDKGGSTTADAALRVASPGVSISSVQPMGRSPQAPVWLETDRGTFLATILRDGTWFVSPATLTGCQAT